MKSIEYVYFCFYSLVKFIRKTGVEQYSAMGLLTIIQGANVYTIIGIVQLNNPEYSLGSRNIGVAIGAVIIILNYLLFIYRDRYLVIEERIRKNDPYKGSVYVLVYVIISIWMFISISNQVRENNLKNQKTTEQIITQ